MIFAVANTSVSPRLKLWTHHPSHFPVDTVTEINPAKSFWWDYDEPGFRYREVWPTLCEMLGTAHFLWCYCRHETWWRMTEEEDRVAWELDVLPSSILSFYSPQQWDKIVFSRSNDWTGLLLQRSTPLTEAVGALVALPLPPGSATCLGSLPVRYPRGSRGRGE
jgi:hypothetical protein